jgi:hypothetical protein
MILYIHRLVLPQNHATVNWSADWNRSPQSSAMHNRAVILTSLYNTIVCVWEGPIAWLDQSAGNRTADMTDSSIHISPPSSSSTSRWKSPPLEVQRQRTTLITAILILYTIRNEIDSFDLLFVRVLRFLSFIWCLYLFCDIKTEIWSSSCWGYPQGESVSQSE